MADIKINVVAYWALALALAALTGWVQIVFRDLHLALLAAMAFPLAMALVSPERPWIWALLIGLAPAAAEFFLISRGEPIRRGEVEVAFGALLPAFVGSLGGHFMRVMVERVFEKPVADTNPSDRTPNDGAVQNRVHR